MKKIIFCVLFTLSITSNAYANIYAGIKFNANILQKLVLFDTNYFKIVDYYMTDGFVFDSNLFVAYN